jgi:hypothetical protein
MLILDWPQSESQVIEQGTHEFIVRITNRADRPRRVIGGTKKCGWNGCIAPKFEEPVLIPPGQTVGIALIAEIRGTGPFELPVVLLLEDNGIRKEEHAIRGTSIGPRSANNAGTPTSIK